MKNVFLSLITVLFFSSCSMEKRLYRPGWFVQTANKKIQESTIQIIENQPEPTRTVSISIRKPIEIQSNGIITEEFRTDFQKEKTGKIFYQPKTYLPDSSVHIKQKPMSKPDFRHSKTKLIYNEDYMLGLGYSLVAILSLAIIVLILILGSPFLIFLIPVVLLGFISSLGAFNRLYNFDNWKNANGFGSKLGVLLMRISIGILFLFLGFIILFVLALVPLILLILFIEWIVKLIYAACRKNR